jgi:hypothetical protein
MYDLHFRTESLKEDQEKNLNKDAVKVDGEDRWKSIDNFLINP